MAGLRDNPFIVRADLTIRYLELINQLSQSPQTNPGTNKVIENLHTYYGEAISQINQKIPK